MQKNTILASCMFFISLIHVPHLLAAETENFMASTCRNCHAPEPGVMMGFLENISVKSRTILMDFLSHKTVVNFNDSTKLVNIESFAEIRNHINKEFSVHYIVKNNKNIATEINRFQPMESIRKGEIKVDLLSLEEFKKARSQPNAYTFDVRPLDRYMESHIPGALPLPAPNFEEFKTNLPKDTTAPVLLYGDGSCFGPITALNAKGMGYENVSIFAGGIHLWADESYNLTTVEWLREAIDKDWPHVLIDLREKGVEEGHIKGAVSIPFASLEENKKNFPYYETAPIILYGPNKDKAAQLIVSWDYSAVRILPVTFDVWKSAKKPIQTGAARAEIFYEPKAKPGTISAKDFLDAVQNPSEKNILVDVRNPDEYSRGHIKGSINIPADAIKNQHATIDSQKNVIFFCPSGIRAEIAHNLFESAGRKSMYLDAYVEFEEDGSYEVEEK